MDPNCTAMIRVRDVAEVVVDRSEGIYRRQRQDLVRTQLQVHGRSTQLPLWHQFAVGAGTEL